MDKSASREEREDRLLEIYDALPEEVKSRFVRWAQRIAALPAEVQDNLTKEQMRRMFDDDTDFPYN